MADNEKDQPARNEGGSIMTTQLQAFHNDPTVKTKYLDRLKAHAAADEIIKGRYWENGKGCAVGCTIHSGRHADYETELGLPQWLARLEDCIFEGMSNEKAKVFPVQFLEAIQVGAKLEIVKAKFFHWLLVDPEAGVIRFAQKEDQQKAIQTVAELYQKVIDGEAVSKEEWRAAYAAAYTAYAAAYTADATYAAYTAYAAAYTADATYAVRAAYAAYAAAHAAAEQFDRMASKLIDLLKEAE